MLENYLMKQLIFCHTTCMCKEERMLVQATDEDRNC